MSVREGSEILSLKLEFVLYWIVLFGALLFFSLKYKVL